MVNTIDCVSYNYNERKRLYSEYLSAKNNFEMLLEEVSNIDDDEEYNNSWCEVEDAQHKSYLAYYRCFAAQFHKCKNEWFRKVVSDLPLGQYKRLTEKQYSVFSKYVFDTDNNNWRDGASYCRVDDYLVTIVRSRFGNSTSIKKERLNGQNNEKGHD